MSTPAFTVRISSELLPICRGPLMVSVCPGWRMTAIAVASAGRGRYQGSSTSSAPPGTGSGAAYGGGRLASPIGAAASRRGSVAMPFAIAASSSWSSCGVSCGPFHVGVLDGVEVRIQRVGERTVELDPDGQDVRRRVCRGVLAGELDLTANHFAAARCGREENNQEVAAANVRFDFPRPRLADGEALIDEHGVAGA